MVELADRSSAAWKDGENVIVHADMTRLTLEIIARSMFGADVSEQAVVVGNRSPSWPRRRGEAVSERVPATARSSDAGQPSPPPGRPPHRRYPLRHHPEDRRDSKEIGNDLLGILIRVCDQDDGSRITDQQLATRRSRYSSPDTTRPPSLLPGPTSSPAIRKRPAPSRNPTVQLAGGATVRFTCRGWFTTTGSSAR